MTTARLEASGIEKSFGKVPVLAGVDLRVAPGQSFALLGSNGAGKSTLMRIVLGLCQPDRGSMRIDGEAYRPRSSRDARLRGVVMVPQERTLCPDLSVAANLTLGVERHTGGVIRRAEERAIVERALAHVFGPKRRFSAEARAGDLSTADQQLVEVARALVQAGIDDAGKLTARVLVLDEPTSSLGSDDAARLFDRLKVMKEQNLAIVLVSHFLNEVREHADRYLVLRDGKVESEGEARTTPASHLVSAMVGTIAESAEAPWVDSQESALDGARENPVALEVIGLRGREKPMRADLVLFRGEVLGIAGLVGSGRTELLRAIAGLDPREEGTVRVFGRLGLLSEDRAGEGLMLDRSITDNTMLSARGPFFVSGEKQRAETRRWMTKLAIRAHDPEVPVGELSGGNQQKVQFARLLREDVDVLLVDEPTRGVDVAAKAQLLALLREVTGRGRAVILVSSQFDELLSTCDRISVLRDGVLDAPRPASSWTESGLLLEAAS